MSETSSNQCVTGHQPTILSPKKKLKDDVELSLPSDVCSTPITNVHPKEFGYSPPAFSIGYSPRDKHDSPEAFSPSTLLLLHRFTLDVDEHKSPLTEVKWADQKELENFLLFKEKTYRRNSEILENHPELNSEMRAILLNWLSEISGDFKLYRETYYLAIDYIDRFLSEISEVPLDCFQLLGTTALFVASKIEEIYPPTLKKLAKATEGACTEDEILDEELLLILSLDWNLNPLTAINWLSIFMQLAYCENGESIVQQRKFPKEDFVQICQVLDLCVLDVQSLKFSSSVLSASAIAHFISKEIAMRVSGLKWDELVPCVTWLKPFVEIVNEHSEVKPKHFNKVPKTDWHSIHVHIGGLELLEKMKEK